MNTPIKAGLIIAALCTSMYAVAQTAPAATANGAATTTQQSGKADGKGKQGKHAKGGKHGQNGGKMMRLDTDKDGAISKSEYDARFTAMDTNKDGKIAGDEIKSGKQGKGKGQKAPAADKPA